MDVSSRVRCSLFNLLEQLRPMTSPKLCSLLRQGLADTDASVRRECESMLQSWFSRVAPTDGNANTTLSCMLKLINVFLAVPAKQSEPLVEAILRRLLGSEEWGSMAEPEQAVQLLLHGERTLDTAQVMLGRIVVSMDPQRWNLSGALKGSLLLRKTLEALDAGNGSTLRQLLMVLLHARVHDEVAAKTLLQMATATLLRCPLDNPSTKQPRATAFAEDRVQQVTLDPFRLAILLARRSLQSPVSQGRACQRSKAQVESDLSETIQTVLRVLGTKVKASFPESGLDDSSGLAEITKCIAAHQSYALAVEERIQELGAKCEQLTNARDFAAAYPLRQEVEQLRQQREEAECKAETACGTLGRHLVRILHVAEAFLSYTEAELEDDFPLFLLLDDVLRPALLLIDSVPVCLGAVCWPALRAQAIRCIALHASLSMETAWQHQFFFHSVLGQYIPEVLSSVRPDVDVAAAVEDIVLTSLSFLIDTLLLHDTSSCNTENGKQGSHIQDGFLMFAKICNANPVRRSACSGRFSRNLRAGSPPPRRPLLRVRLLANCKHIQHAK